MTTEMVSAEEAQAVLDTSPDIAEAVETGCDVLDNALTSGRQRVEACRAMDLLRDVERFARTVIALRAEHTAALDAARREGAAEFRDAILHGPHHLMLSSYQEGRIADLPLPGDATPEAS